MTFRGNHVDELISASLSGDLTDAERAELDAHLARCKRCRATLAAFTAERRILSELPIADPPRDLSARVRGGIESGRLAGPWWGRPGSVVPLLASAAVFAAVVLAVLFFGKLQPAPVGQETSSPGASASAVPSNRATESVEPSVLASSPPLAFLGPGELGYLSLNGGSLQPSRLTFINDATGASVDAGTVSGPPIAAALSPDGQWLAYITQKGETGANEIWALHLTDGKVVSLGCSLAAPFTDRLAWSADSVYLAYTVVAVDLGPTAGCPVVGAAGSTDAWFFDTPAGVPYRVTSTGDAYAASFRPDGDHHTLMVSHAAENPWTEAMTLVADASNFGRVDGAFMPLFSPDGNRAIFWSGTMASSHGQWEFSRGGMPQLSGDFRSTGPASPWVGAPLFTDLVPVGGEAFAYGTFTWGVDSRFAFWNGAWTGAPQGGAANAPYPNQWDGYLGFVDGGLLSATSQRAGGVIDVRRIVDVTFSPGGDSALTIAFPPAGIGDPPSANVVVSAPCCAGEPYVIGGGVNPPPWDGPAVFGR